MQAKLHFQGLIVEVPSPSTLEATLGPNGPNFPSSPINISSCSLKEKSVYSPVQPSVIVSKTHPAPEVSAVWTQRSHGDQIPLLLLTFTKYGLLYKTKGIRRGMNSIKWVVHGWKKNCTEKRKRINSEAIFLDKRKRIHFSKWAMVGVC